MGERETERQKDRETERQRDRETERQRESYASFLKSPKFISLNISKHA